MPPFAGCLQNGPCRSRPIKMHDILSKLLIWPTDGAGSAHRHPGQAKRDLPSSESSGLRMAPRLARTHDGVQGDNELSHDGGDDDFARLAVAPKSVGEEPHDGIAADGDESRHVQRLPDGGSSSLDMARPVELTAVVIDGREAHKAGGFAPGQRAEFRQEGQHSQTVTGPTPLRVRIRRALRLSVSLASTWAAISASSAARALRKLAMCAFRPRLTLAWRARSSRFVWRRASLGPGRAGFSGL